MDIEQLNHSLNENFSGRSLDDFEVPRNTPEERADALCQDAINSYGRRRVQLARKALAEFPSHVEANVLLADSTRAIDRRIELYRRAVDAGRTQLGESMEEYMGRFWGFVETRPFMRACHGLGIALQQAGRKSEAIEQFQEMLLLNPNDNQGVRDALLPLLLEEGRETEAEQLLEQYEDDDTAVWHYINTLLKYRRSGRSEAARKAIHKAFENNKYVAPLYCEEIPPSFAPGYTLGSPEEAQYCLELLREAIDGTEGFRDWMLHEHHMHENERRRQRREDRKKAYSKMAQAKRKRK